MNKPVATTTAESQPQPLKDKPAEKPVKRTREDKHRKKDDKSVEHVLKALSSLETPEAKLAAMCQKYAEILNDHRVLQNTAKLTEKKNSILQREKEQLQADHNKAILTRSRLENLCRELQRQNKAIKDESITAMREEEEKKREVAAMFHSTLTELGNLVSKNNDKNNKLRDDNLDMSTKLKSVCEQYEKKELHVEKLAKQLELEMQLQEAKMAKAKMEMAIERDSIVREKQQLLLEVTQYKQAVEEHQETELSLRHQIQMYNDKYDEFHKALIQSNEAIGGFKQEMERMSKQITRLEKETMTWRTRYESTHKALLQMTDEKLKSDQNACVTFRRLTALQGLCRKLQAQCNFLREELKKTGGSEETKDKEEKSTPSTEPAENESDYDAQIERQLDAEEGAISDNAPCPTKLSIDKAELHNGEVKEEKPKQDKKLKQDEKPKQEKKFKPEEKPVLEIEPKQEEKPVQEIRPKQEEKPTQEVVKPKQEEKPTQEVVIPKQEGTPKQDEKPPQEVIKPKQDEKPSQEAIKPKLEDEGENKNQKPIQEHTQQEDKPDLNEKLKQEATPIQEVLLEKIPPSEPKQEKDKPEQNGSLEITVPSDLPKKDQTTNSTETATESEKKPKETIKAEPKIEDTSKSQEQPTGKKNKTKRKNKNKT